jgi:flagellar biosynthesis protein FliR
MIAIIFASVTSYIFYKSLKDEDIDTRLFATGWFVMGSILIGMVLDTVINYLIIRA